MKKTILILVVILLMSFMLGNTVLSAFAAGKAKSGGILRINKGRENGRGNGLNPSPPI